MTETLYNREILRLAASTAGAALLEAPMARIEKRSPVCGSRVTIDVTLDGKGHLAELGMLVRACALGQASAALFAQAARGRSPAELAAARDALTAWLAQSGPVPDWPGIAVLAPALPHAARHASIRLAFEAGAEAAAVAEDARRAAA